MKTRFLCILTAGLFFLVSGARAAVLLSAGESSLTVNPGESFEVDLYLQITGGEQVSGINYYWQSGAGASGFLSLMGRDIADSLFTILYYENSEVLAAPDNLLDPRNALDLGGFTETAFVSNGTWKVASFTFAVSPSLAPGVYQLATFSDPGTGWATPPPSLDHAFQQQAAVLLTVVPEPSGIGLLLATAFALAGSRTIFRRIHKP